MHLRHCLLALTIVTASTAPALAEHDGKMQVVLLGDSTTECGVPRRHEPKSPMFEETLRLLLAQEKDLPPADVINSGVSGEFIRRLLDQRYDKKVKDLPGVDYIFIRYGINDAARRENFDENYPKDYHELLERLRRDHPKARIIVMSSIPFSRPETDARINALNQKVAEDEKLPFFDIVPRYAAELEKQGPNALNYRRFPLEQIPEERRALALPFAVGKPARVEVMDNRLDGVYGDLPGWFGDRHPSLAGYTVIADETAKWLRRYIRESGSGR